MQLSALSDASRVRRRRAMLIQRVYEVDPLVCRKCGGKMKVISIEAQRVANR